MRNSWIQYRPGASESSTTPAPVTSSAPPIKRLVSTEPSASAISAACACGGHSERVLDRIGGIRMPIGVRAGHIGLDFLAQANVAGRIAGVHRCSFEVEFLDASLIWIANELAEARTSLNVCQADHISLRTESKIHQVREERDAGAQRGVKKWQGLDQANRDVASGAAVWKLSRHRRKLLDVYGKVMRNHGFAVAGDGLRDRRSPCVAGNT